jgi:hypothetical protein
LGVSPETLEAVKNLPDGVKNRIVAIELKDLCEGTVCKVGASIVDGMVNPESFDQFALEYAGGAAAAKVIDAGVDAYQAGKAVKNVLEELPPLPDGYHYKNVNGEDIVSRNPGQAESLPQLRLENGKLVEVEPASVSYHRQSELDVGNTLPEGTLAQQAFKDGVPVPHNTQGSVRPDFCDAGRCDWSVEVKNYDLSRPSGQRDLVDNVSTQAVERHKHLPSGMEQQVVIDVRGQNITVQQQNEIRKGVVDKSEGAIDINSIRFLDDE